MGKITIEVEINTFGTMGHPRVACVHSYIGLGQERGPDPDTSPSRGVSPPVTPSQIMYGLGPEIVETQHQIYLT